MQNSHHLKPRYQHPYASFLWSIGLRAPPLQNKQPSDSLAGDPDDSATLRKSSALIYPEEVYYSCVKTGIFKLYEYGGKY